MSVESLNHINICAPLHVLQKVRDFYTDLLGLQDGWRPDFPMAGFWLYADGKPIVHLMEASAQHEQTPSNAIGYLDHIAFTCSSLELFLEKFEERGVEYTRRDFPQFNTVQLVVKDPTGMDVELNFHE